jgi:hypothetical protein
MIQITKTLPNTDAIQRWLEAEIRKYLQKDVSNYAKGRLRTWLNIEPSLTSPTTTKQGTGVSDKIVNRLKDLICWDFDYALVTYSGDNKAIGIAPHRDASYADYEARALHISGECRFDYWMGRKEFGKSVN